MAQRSEAFRSGRFYLPTVDLTQGTGKQAPGIPAFHNNYDVSINFNKAQGGLKSFIDQHGFYDQNNAGSDLALYCSEAVLPGSEIKTAQVSGLRQGINQKYATFREFPDVQLTYYAQTDYYTNDVFNAWMEFISPTSGRDNPAFRRMKYPETYKCDMEITGFSKDSTSEFSKLNRTSRFNSQLPSSITYKLINVFPTTIVAAPLSYGRAELVKTTVIFKYDQYFIDRTSRVGGILEESVESDRILGGTISAEAAALSEDTGMSVEDAQTIANGGFVETEIG